MRSLEPTATAFVLNISLAGLGAVRSLGRAGIPVVGLDPDTSHAGFASRYCRADVCPHPVRQPEQLLESLLEAGHKLPAPGVLSPASDGFVLFMSRYRDELAKLFRFAMAPSEVVESVVNKRKLYELADRHGMPHATLHCPESLDDVHRVKNDVCYPVYLKPYESHVWELTLPRDGKGIKVHSPDELVGAYERIFRAGVRAMIQSVIEGPASNVRTVYAYMGDDGEPLAVLTTRKFRQYPVEFGTGSMAESYDDPQLRELGVQFFRDIGFRGFGTVEFKLDDHDGRFKLTDLNPRWVKPINLPIASGVDFPLIHYRDVIGDPPEPQLHHQTGVRWVQWVNDIASAWPEVRSGDLSPLTLAREWSTARSYSVFAIDDPGPFLKDAGYGRRLLRAPKFLWRQLKASAGSSGDSALRIRPDRGA